MWFDDASKHYADYSKKINEKYCEKKGFDFVYSDKKLLSDYHPAWERLPLLLEQLNSNKYDYMWIDADACFNFNSEFDLRTTISNNENKDIIFSDDCPPYTFINTGVILLKNSKFSKKFIKNIIISKRKK